MRDQLDTTLRESYTRSQEQLDIAQGSRKEVMSLMAVGSSGSILFHFFLQHHLRGYLL